MTLKDFINGLMKCDLYDLYMWVTFLSTKMSCKGCVKALELKGKIPDCNKCVPSKTLIKKVKKILEEKDETNGTKS